MEQTRQPISPGELLRDFLEDLGVSQSRLAQHIGVSLTTISTIVNGSSRITVEMAAKLGCDGPGYVIPTSSAEVIAIGLGRSDRREFGRSDRE